MKIILCVLASTFLVLSIFGQEVETKPNYKSKVGVKNQREPESHWSNLISMQIGFTFGIHGSFGSSLSFVYEQKLKDKPIAWFANYTVGVLYDYSSDMVLVSDDQFEEADEFSFEFHHFGGGVHYYPLNYERSFKPYFGGGCFIGVNKNEYEFDNGLTLEKSGFDAGVYGVIGARWFTRLFRIGTEYRVGYINTEIMDVNKSYSIHEIVFYFGIRF